MKQELFIARHAPQWAAFERWLDQRGGRIARRRGPRTPAPSAATPQSTAPLQSAAHSQHDMPLRDEDMPSHYRKICHQAALAYRRGYSPQVAARLQVLIQRGHDVLYRAPPTLWRQAGWFLFAAFPRLVRAQRGCLWLSALLFFGSTLLMYALGRHWPDLVYAVFSSEQLAEYETTYAPGGLLKDGRGDQGDMHMFGFYIFNNISIGFRTFASGLLAGVGTLMALLFNGLHSGLIAAHLHGLGHGAQFWPFVVGHSAPELIAIVIAGAAGLQLGLALIAPGRLRRGDALRKAGAVGARLCAGVFLMLLFAAFVEAFWSAQVGIPAAVKFSVGALLWLLVLAWLGMGGRAQESGHDAA